jgi:glycopeptide antibiotics resistance protein
MSMPPPRASRGDDWGPFLFYATCIFIALLTLFPYQILPGETELKRQTSFFLWFFEKVPSRGDLFANMLLFAPFGFSSGLLLERRLRWPLALGLTCAASCAFSFAIELAQSFMPTRTSSWFDVLANTAGGPLGWIVFRIAGQRINRLLSSGLDTLLRVLNLRRLTALFIAYAVLGIVTSIPLSRMAMLSNWDVSYPLGLGNGMSAWDGQVLELAIAERVVRPAEAEQVFRDGLTSVVGGNILASYQFTDPADIVDRSGRPSVDGRRAVSISGGSWLQSESATKLLATRIRDANRFSLYMVCAAKQSSQPGMNPIVVLGEDMDRNDFLLGQYYTSLAFRLRTPLSTSHWEVAQYRAGRFFQKTGIHKILLTYDGAFIRSYLDGKTGYAPELGPGAALFRHIWTLHQYETPGYKALYYGLIFAPLGCILALASKITKPLPALALGCGLFAPGALLEPILVGVSHRPFYPGNGLLGIGLTIASYVFIRHYLPR